MKKCFRIFYYDGLDGDIFHCFYAADNAKQAEEYFKADYRERDDYYFIKARESKKEVKK